MKFPSNIFLIITVDLVKNCIPLNSYFSAIPELDNKIGTTHLLQETSASSSSVCGAMCMNNCNCFGYNPLQKRCRLHVMCNTEDMPTSETGWQYYTAGNLSLSLSFFLTNNPILTWWNLYFKNLEILWAMLTKWYPRSPMFCVAKSLFCSGKPQNHADKNLK